MLKLWVETYTRNRDIFMKLCAEMVFRFQWHIEKLTQELGIEHIFFSISLLRVIKIEQTQIWRMYVANIKVYRSLPTNELMLLIFFLDKTYKVDHLELISSLSHIWILRRRHCLQLTCLVFERNHCKRSCIAYKAQNGY